MPTLFSSSDPNPKTRPSQLFLLFRTHVYAWKDKKKPELFASFFFPFSSTSEGKHQTCRTASRFRRVKWETGFVNIHSASRAVVQVECAASLSSSVAV